MTITLKPQPLTKERFAPYGDVIESVVDRTAAMNAARFERFDDLCSIDMQDDGRVAVSIARCRVATSLPYRIDMVERHPLGSQAFVPLTPCKLIVVVAPPEESVEASDLRAFVTNGRQGINYHRGTWHMPLIAFKAGQEFLIIDRAADMPNCDEHSLDEAVTLAEA
ncbi:MAG: ureidoglycolate lyase [Gammaproteobacteria bacterium]|jgi:ureidoglycolate lyase|nr:ureidoglycolate lyase [Gammaproteobacteria bacterium]MDH3749980.1 ureidoglycolate lyase [Gammaproteobacteria bacterium]MDH3805752.1 ureidoglycolate lyase [Gammaproteobacteria bacterium]